ncbi:helix-turn-helix transcriptional regulator [Marivirga sp. S37H4]|uniref:Helix-turn-helix transcriptional regulator n=1 Tax=Marivirga aurantiaca TaxID=2802615 RepID=A0A934WW06_9BACT|nr:AraC family transcriptional regulator [Marivirga aurantiaca]MBK6264089.1 helix-turn-helix transcriptional regulator [Marivirga aurantiaca]
MDLIFKYDIHYTCKKIIQEKLDKLGIDYEYTGVSEVKVFEDLSQDRIEKLKSELDYYGINLVEDKKKLLVQKIKNAIVEMIYLDEGDLVNKTSIHLSEKLNLSYGYLSNVFTEETLSTIENFIILQKIEMAKVLLTKEDLSLTEIAYKLNYSSVAHLSNQFKKKIGLTPSAFQRVLEKRKQLKQKDNN